MAKALVLMMTPPGAVTRIKPVDALVGTAAVIWVAVGGRGTLTGAALGAVLVNYAKTYFTSGVLAPYWLFMLGSLFIGVTLLLPRGIVGTLNHWTALRRDRASAAAEDGVTPPEPLAAE